MRFDEGKLALVRTKLCSLSSPFLGLGLAAAGIWLTVVTWRELRTPSRQGFRHAFRAISYYAVMVMGAIILDAMLGR
jgi:hypothetical protein